MDGPTVTALIAAGSSLLVLYLGTHVEAIKERLKRKQKSKDESEEKKRRFDDRLVAHMVAIRETSRRQIEGFTRIQKEIESAPHDLSRQEVDAVFSAARSTTSSQTDVALRVGLTCPAVRDRWFDFIDLRSRYMEGVEEFLQDADPGRHGELGDLLERLKAARSRLLDEMKVAAEGLGHPLLVRDVDIDDSGVQ
ncbi:hypothetical protein AB0G20_09535 [Streptomyces sp. NPDC024017]|uniref:hypothetical protein n=1 Tax=Streptomyces sp. NPDC024017 TaxID=3154326 RepID=UPI0033EFF45F